MRAKVGFSKRPWERLRLRSCASESALTGRSKYLDDWSRQWGCPKFWGAFLFQHQEGVSSTTQREESWTRAQIFGSSALHNFPPLPQIHHSPRSKIPSPSLSLPHDPIPEQSADLPFSSISAYSAAEQSTSAPSGDTSLIADTCCTSPKMEENNGCESVRKRSRDDSRETISHAPNRGRSASRRGFLPQLFHRGEISEAENDPFDDHISALGKFKPPSHPRLSYSQTPMLTVVQTSRSPITLSTQRHGSKIWNPRLMAALILLSHFL